MASDLVPLHFETADVRMIVRDGEPWWVLNDVCSVLSIANPRNVAQRLDDYQKGVHSVDTLGGFQDLTLVNEAGIYALTLNSRKASAKEFARWVFVEVLPSIRKFGMYPPPDLDALPVNDWADGVGKPLHTRFREERLAWEERTGYSLADLPDWSKAVIIAVEAGNGGLFKRRRVEMIVRAGLDVAYILTGKRTLSPQERRAVDFLRHESDPRAIALLAMSQGD